MNTLFCHHPQTGLAIGEEVGREDAARAVEPGVQRRADNKVAIAKEEGALAALVALWCAMGGSAVGKENAVGTWAR